LSGTGLGRLRSPGLGAIIGSGIFLTPGGIARTTQSTAAVLFRLDSGRCADILRRPFLCGMALHIPRGGIYVFLRKPTGRATAFLFAGACSSSWLRARSPRWRRICDLPQLSRADISVRLEVLRGGGDPDSVLINCLGVRSGALVQNLLGVIKIGSLIGSRWCCSCPEKGISKTSPPLPGHLHRRPGVRLDCDGCSALAYEGWYLLTFAAGK